MRTDFLVKELITPHADNIPNHHSTEQNTDHGDDEKKDKKVWHTVDCSMT